MKNILILLLLVGSLRAETYYISTSGSDGNSGLTSALPWKSLEKIEGFTFASGDSILFKSGDVFQGDLFLPSSNLYIGKYDNGKNPTFKADSIPVANWVSKGSGIFSNVPGDNLNTGGWVWVDNVPLFPRATDSLLTDGEFYLAAGADDKIFIRLPSGVPSDYDVRFIWFTGWLQNGIHLDTVSNVTIENIDFEGMQGGIIADQDCSNILIQNCNFKYVQSAILLQADTLIENVIIRNNYFYRCHNAVRFYTSFWYHGAGDYQNAAFSNCNVIANEFDQGGYTNDQDSIWNDGATDYEAFGAQNLKNSEIAYNYYHDGLQIGCIFYANASNEMNDNIIHHNVYKNNQKIFFITSGDAQASTALFGFSGNRVYQNLIINSGDGGNPHLWFHPGNGSTYMNYMVNNTCIDEIGDGGCVIQVSRADVIPAYMTASNNYMVDAAGTPTYYINAGATQLDTTNNVWVPLGSELLDARRRPLINSPAISAGKDVGLPYHGLPDVGAFERNQ